MPNTSDSGLTHDQKQGGKRRRGGGRLPVFRFVLFMVVFLIAFNAFFYGWFSKSAIFDGYLLINADVSAAVLGFFGEEGVMVKDSVIMSPRFSLGIKRGCDAIQPAVFFAFFVAASPVLASRWRKAKAITIGIALILLINLFRLVSLYYVGVFWKSAFEWVHVEFWQMVFIALPIIFWLVWARKQQMKGSETADASS